MDIELQKLLDRLPGPAFCVEARRIHYCNGAAQAYGLAQGADLEPMLASGREEYTAYMGGSLYLTLQLYQGTMGAEVVQMGVHRVFLLDESNSSAELRALSLAAMELRGPLNSILTLAEQEQNPQMNRRLFQMMRMVSNMSDAFRYAQAEAGRMEFLQINSLFDEIFQQAGSLLEQAGIHLEYTGLSQQVFTLADPELLERAAYNLLSNAAKFLPKDGYIRVQLSCRGNRLALSVSDNGPGISADILENLYSRFQRRPTLEDPRYGIGLGMVLVRCAAAIHSGAVLVDHLENQGNRTTMTLAIRQPKQTILRSPAIRIDYAGEWDHGLLELSDCLPAELYNEI